MIQGGAGTSTNMNANEVIANRALEHLGQPAGSTSYLHPLQDVNLGQSTNDVYPTAINIALDAYVVKLDAALDVLHAAFLRKAAEFADVIKMGRTQLQDAVPMTLGQEFAAYGITLAEDRAPAPGGPAAAARAEPGRHRDRHRTQRPPRVPAHVAIEHLREITGIPTLVSAAGSGRGDLRCRRLRPAVRCAQAGRGEAVQDVQRPAAAVVRSARRVQRDQPAGPSGRVEHHAGQGQPGDPRGGQPGRLRGDRQRRHRHHGRRGRAVAAQRLRADHRALPVRQPGPPGAAAAVTGGTVHRRHHRQPRTAPRRGSRTRSGW